MKTNSYFATGVDVIERTLAQFGFDSFLSYMPIILDFAREICILNELGDSRRGYLTLMNGITGEIVFTAPFGEIPEEKNEKYFELSQEKANRLFTYVNMHLPNGHTTSFESRNEEEQKYGGAIYLNGRQSSVILSFSGMPELIDEAMMLVLADMLAKDIHLQNITRIDDCRRTIYREFLQEKFLGHPFIMSKRLNRI